MDGTATLQSQPVSRWSLARALLKTFGVDFVLQQLCELVSTALRLCNPLVLGVLVDYLGEPGAPVGRGYLLCLLLVGSSLTQTLISSRTSFMDRALDLRVRSAIVSSVFRKALRMDAESRQRTTVGQAVNLMSVDAEDVSHCLCRNLSQLGTAPVRVLVVLLLLYRLLGPAMLVGVLVLVMMIPLNVLVAGKLSKQQTQLMDLKDRRLQAFTEVINGIKVLKMNAWEPSYRDTVHQARTRELDVMWRKAVWETIVHFYWHVAPNMVTVAVFVSYVYSSEDGHLAPGTVFVALVLMDLLQEVMGNLPEVLGHIVKVVVSLGRVAEFLNRPDLQDNVTADVDHGVAISIRHASFAWSSRSAPVLKNITVRVKRGSLVAVVGPVGCGKSSLLSACLGHMTTLRGHVSRQGSIAYVPQQAWIQHATLKDNVLFGQPLNHHSYQQCLDACALRPDLRVLPGGDLTEIGEKGINLSGGQKQRVSLARAVYSEADLYLLDDPLSAVDSHVGAHIFRHVIGPEGLLAGKTRVLVTHGLQWLPLVDEIVVMTPDGGVREVGSYSELLHRDGHFARFLHQYSNPQHHLHDDKSSTPKSDISDCGYGSADTTTTTTTTNNNNNVRSGIICNGGGDFGTDSKEEKRSGIYTETDVEHHLHRYRDDHSQSVRNETKDETTLPEMDDGGADNISTEEDEMERNEEEKKEELKRNKGTLVDDDDEKVYHATWSTFRHYGRAVGGGWAALLLLLFVVQQSAQRAGDVTLSRWTEHPDPHNLTAPHPPDSPHRQALNRRYLSIFLTCGLLHAVTSLSFKITLLIRQIYMAGMLHHRMLSRVLRAPMAFFDTTPVGRILHRFANNLHVMDTELTDTMEALVEVTVTLASKAVVLCYLSPVFLLLLPPAAAAVYFCQYWYIPAMRQMARLEFISVASSYSFFSETLGGAAVIRAFGAQPRFIREFERRADLAFGCMFSWDGIIRWVEVRLRVTGAVMVGVVVLYLVHHRDSVSAGTAGLALALILEMADSLQMVVFMLSWLQCELVSVDRVMEYCNMPVEAEWSRTDTAPCPSWPQRGEVKVTDLDLRYREGLNLVLKNINVHIRAGEKVGIVGHTGAGKSSFTLALFRLVEPARGQVTIDDLCTSDLGLHDLRSRLTILPQDPVIFAGSLRMNLDPFAHYTDAEVWSALRHAHLSEFVSGLEGGLLYECGEGGENLSMGQRQLLCLARALLHQTRLLVLDEATAAVDLRTDDVIQQTLRRRFAQCTVLTIAHRLRTVLDYDRILVLERGEVVEYDSPSALLATPTSRFHHMARKAGLLATPPTSTSWEPLS